MSSLPFSVLSTQIEDILPLLSIQEHQKFCKSLLKSYQSYKKKSSDEKTDISKIQFDDFFQIPKKQNQDEILKWFENLTIYDKIKICTIKNKWLVHLFIQLYLVYKTYDTSYLKPTVAMKNLFQAQKNFSHGNEESQFINLNIPSEQNYNKNAFSVGDLNYYENFFSLECTTNNYKMFNSEESVRREKEKRFIDNIKLLSLEDKTNIIDTLTLNKDFLMNFKEVKDFLKYFSNNKYFQDWLLPIKINNIYNFVLPQWMHNNQSMTLIHIIIGYLEQQILLNYEYYYYSKRIYEYSYSNLIVNLYEENKKLVTFVKENYSFHNHNDDINKKEFISLMEIREIVRNIKKTEEYENKINYLQNIYNYVYNNEFNSQNKNCILNIDFDKQIYEDLYKESMSEGESGIIKVLEHITFMKFQDIVNARESLFTALRKKIFDSFEQKNMDELMSDNFLSGKSSSNKKKKNKKKKKKNKNNENNKTQNKEDIKENSSNNKNISEEDKKDLKDNHENIRDIKEKNILINDNEEDIKEIKEFNLLDKNYFETEKYTENNIHDINNIVGEDIKIINYEENKSILMNNQKNDSNYLTDINNSNDNKKEAILNNYYNIEEDIKEELKIENNKNISKKNKIKKEFFLYPTNNNSKKIKKKKNLHSLSAKKSNHNTNKNLIEEKKKSKNNSPIPRINKENVKNIYQFNITNINLKMEPKFQEKIFLQAKSPSPFSTQHQSFSFFNNTDNSQKSANISTNTKIKNEDISKNVTNITNDINDTNININNDNNSNDSDFKKIYSNIPIISNSYSPYTPSEKFFESLTKEINNYTEITNKNITNLKPVHLKYITQIENIIKSSLESKYDIKFGHYGSHFTNLSIEGSDVDILINYKQKNNENNSDFLKDILSVLNQNEDMFDLIKPIFTASVPVIKLKIDIKSEIKDIKLKYMPYFEDENELSKMNIDLTFAQNEQEYQHSHQIVSYINQSLISLPIIKSLLLILKRYFKIMKMNKSFHGGLSSYSLYLLIYTFCKKFPISISSSGKALYSFLGFFSFFEFHKYGVDVENINIYYLYNNYISNNYNYNYEEQIMKKEINIIDPLTKLNVAKSSFKVDEIQGTFRSAYDFLIREGCYYDYAILVNKTGFENDIFNHIETNFDKDINSDFKILKKLFELNKKRHFFDLYAN